MRVKLRRKIFLITFIFLLVLPLVSATISLTPVNNHINTAESGSFELKVSNDGDVSKNYKVYSLELGWIIDPLPRDRTFTLNPGQSRTTTITVKAIEEFSPGAYAPTLYIDEYVGNNYNTQTMHLKVYLSPEKAIDYLPSFLVEVDMDDKLDPRDAYSIKLFLENRNPLDLSNLTVKIQSDMPEFLKELNVNLPPLEKKTLEFSVTANPYQQPKNYILFFVFEKDGQTVKVVEKNLEITRVLPEFVLDVNSENVFLKKFSSINVRNAGNVLNTQEVKIPISFLSSLITSGPTSFKVIDGERYGVWELELSPNENTTVNMVTNYRLIIYILIAILLFLSFYYYVQSPVVIAKTAVTTASDDEGALSQIKVTLEVKNRTKKPIKEINIIDIIPGIANLEKSLELGTLKPHQIKHTQKGTKVVWSLVEIDAHEHRLITYKVKAKLNILGTLSLPRAIIEYKGGKSVKKAYSNVYKLG